MSEDIKGLIEKIQKEGITAAENKAKEIEALAVKRAEEIITEAKRDAKKIISEAGLEAKRAKESTQLALSQAARDMLLSLEREINAMLMRLVAQKVHEALTAEELAKIIHSSIKEHAAKAKEEIIISLSKSDAQRIEGLLGDLKEQVKAKIIVRPADEIQAGFMISFDSGRSQFDFSEKALAEYIGSYLKPRLNEILKTAIP